MSDAFRPLVFIAALTLAGQAVAEDGAQRAALREDAGARVRQVERDGGRVLQAQPMRQGDRETYRIKVLTPEGRVRVLETPREPTRASEPPPPPRERMLPEDFPRNGNMLRERSRAREAAERERIEIRGSREAEMDASPPRGPAARRPGRPQEPRRRDD